MASQLIFITTLLLITNLTISKDWKCEEGDIEIALVYDCRHNLQIQKDFFTQFLNTFQPVKWISDQHKLMTKRFQFKLFLMTYGRDEIKTFQTLTTDNFTENKFNETTIQINTSSCPQNLPIHNVFNETRKVFSGAENNQRKLAIFILDQNITDKMSDYNVSRWLESEQIQSYEIKRLFIMTHHKKRRLQRGLYLLNTNNLNNIDDVVEKSIGLICNQCTTKYKGYKSGSSCYFVLELNKEMTREEANKLCDKTWFQSQLVSLNTQKELDFVASIYEKHFKDLFLKNEVCVYYYKTACVEYKISRKRHGRLINFNESRDSIFYEFESNCHISICYLKKSYFNSFIGLSFSKTNRSVDLIWSDNTPFVLMARLPSLGDSKNCFYLSHIYYRDNKTDSIKSKGFEWINYNCKIKIRIHILLCESNISDKPIKRIDLNDFQSKKQMDYNQVVYKSFKSLLFSQFNYDLSDAIILIMKNKLSLTITQIEHAKSCFSTENRHLIKRHKIRSSKEQISSVQSIKSDLCNLNEFDSCITHQLACSMVKNNNIVLNESNGRQNDVLFIRTSNSTENTCLFEIEYNRQRAEYHNNNLLQNCEQVVCPGGFVKCPDSYCIPAYLVRDGTNDCPHGEDEEFIKDDTSLCQGKFKFTFRSFCLEKDICNANTRCLNESNDFDCRAVCSDTHICMSNLKRNKNGQNSTFYVFIIETIVQLYEITNSFLFTPQVYSLFQFFKLVDINLRQCTIRNLDDVIEKLYNSAVINLDVSGNHLSRNNNFSAVTEMKNLKFLNVSYNENLELDVNFMFPLNLQIIDLSYTKSGKSVINKLVNLTQLSILILRHVEPIDLSKVSVKVKLNILDVRGTEIVNITDGYLRWLTIGKALYTDNFKLCCEVIRRGNISAETCHAPRDAISTCQDLIGDPLKRVILWVVGVLSILGNFVVVIYRLLWDRAVFKTAYALFVVCLGVSDFIMGVYLLIVAGADMLYRNLYVLNDMYWRHSNTCQLAGILSTFSSETSTMFICLITLDRYLVIRYPFGEHRFSKSGKITSICLTLVVGVVVSVMPAVFPGWEIYSTNGMCLALPFSAGRHIGWEYSAILFVGLNFVLFIIIAIGQLAIFWAIRSKNKNSSSIRDNVRRSQDYAVARQLFLVAMSDFCCWFPIGIMGIMSLNGYHFNPEVYAWSAVLILPVNSAINPLIYTFLLFFGR